MSRTPSCHKLGLTSRVTQGPACRKFCGSALPRGWTSPDKVSALCHGNQHLAVWNPQCNRTEHLNFQQDGPDGTSAAEDVRNTWVVQRDAAKQQTICRSLMYPGYAFFYDEKQPAWGDLYLGSGVRNNDLIFML